MTARICVARRVLSQSMCFSLCTYLRTIKYSGVQPSTYVRIPSRTTMLPMVLLPTTTTCSMYVCAVLLRYFYVLYVRYCYVHPTNTHVRTYVLRLTAIPSTYFHILYAQYIQRYVGTYFYVLYVQDCYGMYVRTYFYVLYALFRYVRTSMNFFCTYSTLKL